MEKITGTLLSWASHLDENTREQAVTTSRMPFVFPHVALMPDAHLGLGATVGSVIPTLRAIVPAAVGVDIGCGMIAVRTTYTREQLPADRTPVREAIERAVPLSAGARNRTVSRDHTRERLQELTLDAERRGLDPAHFSRHWELQLGTLGSGNHFIEVTVDEEDRVWLFLHSGSRGVGNRIAQHHIGVAREQCERWWIELPHRDLAYLVEGTDEFDRGRGSGLDHRWSSSERDRARNEPVRDRACRGPVRRSSRVTAKARCSVHGTGRAWSSQPTSDRRTPGMLVG